MYMLAAPAQDGGLTVGEIIADIPHDGPTIFVYVLVAAFAFFIWWGNRGSGPAESASSDDRNDD